ncbi:MAG: arylsulfatase, partial [Planctomycetota bacterium]
AYSSVSAEYAAHSLSILGVQPMKSRLCESQRNARVYVPFLTVLFVVIPQIGLGQSTAIPSPPNIVFMMADDMGMGDTSAYKDVTGNQDSMQISTPNMERLARMGIRFTDAHTPSSRCTGTRYGLMTGRYPWRNRMKHWVLFGSQGDPMIEADRPTIASILRGKGYGTAIVGKWHVGLRYRQSNGRPAQGWQDADLLQPLYTTPVDHGFQFARFTSRSHGTSGPDAEVKDPSKRKNNGPGHVHGRRVVAATGNGKELSAEGPDAYRLSKLGSRHSNHAIEFMSQHIQSENSKDDPFFLYYPSNSNHGPYTPDTAIAGQPVLGQARSVDGAAMNTRYDFIYENDIALGRLLDFLETTADPRNPARPLIDNTLVIFTSDNGAEIKDKTATGPFRSNKGSAFEGGHRVPFIAAWKDGAVGDGVSNTRGATSQVRIGLIDMFATFCELTRQPLPNLLAGEKGGEDSHSVLAALRGQDMRRPPAFHNDHNESKRDKAHVAFRMDSPVVDGLAYSGQWKLFFDEGLIRYGITEPYALYDLASDPREQVDRIDDPKLQPLVASIVEQAALHRNAGGHRWTSLVSSSPTERISWVESRETNERPWLQRSQSGAEEHSAKINVEALAPSDGNPESAAAPQQEADTLSLAQLNETAKGLGAHLTANGGNPRLIDQSEVIHISFDRDVVIEWIALEAGPKGRCGGSYRVGNGAPLAIYCTDTDNDAKDQHGVLSDIGLLPRGEFLVLDSGPHYGSESPGAWKLQAIQYRVVK